MSSIYSIESALCEPLYGETRNGLSVSKRTLNALGLTQNATGEVMRVAVSGNRMGSWGVDIPVERAEEYARQAWKDEHTTCVTLGTKNFPKPTTLTLEEAQKQLDDFKKKVYEVALAAKKTEGWCDSGFKAALDKLDITPPKRMTRVVLEFEVPADVNPDDFNSVRNHIEADFLWDGIFRVMKTVEPVEG